MRRINIYEQDFTTVGSETLTQTDVVYIPGFCAGFPDPNGIEIRVEGSCMQAYTPTLCTSVNQFENYFGQEPAAFAEDQYYPELGDGSYGFTPEALASLPHGEDNVWFASGDIDYSYIYAKELLIAGIPVIYERVNEEINSKINVVDPDTGAITVEKNEKYDVTVRHMYDYLSNQAFNVDTIFQDSELYKSQLIDLGVNSFKYLTSGAYPAFEYVGPNGILSNNMMKLCSIRGDALALVDPINAPDRVLYDLPSNNEEDKPLSVYGVANSTGVEKLVSSFGTIVYPWIESNLISTYAQTYINRTVELPGSFAYLKSLANSLYNNNFNWQAIAGTSRGLIPDFVRLCLNSKLTNSIAEYYVKDSQEPGVSLNAITNITPYGYCIWGNRTLSYQTSEGVKFATRFLNIRNIASDVKKKAYTSARSLMFEQNSDVLWVEFKDQVCELLDQLKSGSAISGYQFIKNSTYDKTKLSCTIRLYPIYPIEKFDIFLELADEEIELAEEIS